jgi:hypothetical protein
VDISPCVVFYSRDPAEVLAGLVAAHEEEVRAIVPGHHNIRRLHELVIELARYKTWLAAADGRQPRRTVVK